MNEHLLVFGCSDFRGPHLVHKESWATSTLLYLLSNGKHGLFLRSFVLLKQTEDWRNNSVDRRPTFSVFSCCALPHREMSESANTWQMQHGNTSALVKTLSVFHLKKTSPPPPLSSPTHLMTTVTEETLLFFLAVFTHSSKMTSEVWWVIGWLAMKCGINVPQRMHSNNKIPQKLLWGNASQLYSKINANTPAKQTRWCYHANTPTSAC